MKLYGKRICVVGCGSVGTECSKRFKAFGCYVIGVELLPQRDEYYERIVGLKDLDTELPSADVVVLTLPLTDESRHITNAEKLDLLKDSSVLVNIAREAVVDTDSLVKCVDRIGGAVLDVFEKEPLDADNLLWIKENVVLIPHNSLWVRGNGNRLSKVIIDNLILEVEPQCLKIN